MAQQPRRKRFNYTHQGCRTPFITWLAHNRPADIRDHLLYVDPIGAAKRFECPDCGHRLGLHTRLQEAA